MRLTKCAQSSIYVVAVCFDLSPQKIICNLRRLGSSVGRHLECVVVVNNPEQAMVQSTLDNIVIRGSNKYLDFSGFIEGLIHLNSIRPNSRFTNVLFLNDSLFTKHASKTIFKKLLDLDALLSDIRVPAIAGKGDRYRSICMYSPWSFAGNYISSFCFLLNGRAQKEILTLIQHAEEDGLLNDLPLDADAWATGVSPTFREFIRGHLIYTNSPYLWRLGLPENDSLIQRKALCVYFEHRLSGAIGVSGALVPINVGWSATLHIFGYEYISKLRRNALNIFNELNSIYKKCLRFIF